MKQKFLTTKIELVNSKLKDLTNNEYLMKAELVVCIEDIIGVREDAQDDDDSISPDICRIYLSSGEAFTIFTPYEEVKSLVLNKYFY